MQAGLGLAIMFLFWLVLTSFILVLPAWLLWNWLMPQVFGLPEIGFMQCLGLLLLAGMLLRAPMELKLSTE